MAADAHRIGRKDYHWAMIEVTPDDTPGGQDDGHAFLLLRRHRYTGTISYFLCRSPDPVPLAKLIAVAVTRLAYAFLAVTASCQRALDASAAALGLIPVAIPELLRQLRGHVIPEPRRDKPHRDVWALWRRRHQYGAQQAHQRWHAYADETPR